MLLRALYLLICVGCYFASWKWLNTYQYADYKDYLNLISAVSGMVFTIMGIWIAFLYPNAMSRIINSKKLIAADFSESQSDSKRLESIVGAVMTSALVMLGVLLITLAKIIIQMMPFYMEYRIEFKAIALSTLIFITFLQLEAVINVVLSNVMFINDLHFKRQARQSDEEM
jgi:hypothetical protein